MATLEHCFDMTRFARIALTLVIAAAIAALPVSVSHAGEYHAGVAVAAAPASNCGGHHQQPASQPSKAIPGCAAIAGCATVCLNSSIATVSSIDFPPAAAATTSLAASAAIIPQPGYPPFRPPRS